MSEFLCSVGIDVGTTTTQLVVSELKVENVAMSFTVPKLHIAQRKIIYESDVYFTPMLSDSLIDGEGVRKIVAEIYRKAGITPEKVDTGAIIITGETSRKENAKAVLSALSEFAGEFVVTTAGPDLESELAAKGAGAVELSKQVKEKVLHIDIGGGTSNFSLIQNGKILQTGCMNIGGRLVKLGDRGELTYVSPVLSELTNLKTGDIPTESDLENLAEMLAGGLEMAAGLKEKTEVYDKLLTLETTKEWEIPKEKIILSFSGGVADCLVSEKTFFAFGDLGVYLGRAISNSLLCKGEYHLGRQTIRATVIGAGCYSTQLSGSTVFYRNIDFPLKNIPVILFTRDEQDSDSLPDIIKSKISQSDSDLVALAFEGYNSPSYDKVSEFADKIYKGIGNKMVAICLQYDMAKALGHSLCLKMAKNTPCLCIDQVVFSENSYLDVGAPIGPALPIVVKTLILKGE